MPVVHWRPGAKNGRVEAFMSRPTFDPQAESIAAELLADIRKRGLTAVIDAAGRIDGVSLKPATLRVSQREIDKAERLLSEETKKRIVEAHDRVADFASKSMRKDWRTETPGGGFLGERWNPLERVGIYVPGGTAPLASTVIMTATLAQVAGVPQIVACTPCAKDLSVRPEVLFAMRLCGVTEIYRVGGIQAIGLMAYGGGTIAPVDKIVGPGNAFVTAAKRQVYGTVALDLVAGPSEIAVLADDSASAEWVAADLLSQSEHGSGHERSLFVTDSPTLAAAVAKALPRRIAAMGRREIVERVVAAGGILLVVVPDLDAGMALVNRFAPEHFEIAVKKPERWIPLATKAGAVFAGHWTTESAGDFAAGPSHVLPTGGAAAKFGGLTVDDFRHRTSVVQYTKKDLRDALPVIRAFADIEGLGGHRAAADVRFEKGTRKC